MTHLTIVRGQAPLEKVPPEPDDLRLWSVTTIIGVLDKPALIYWAAEETAKAAVNDRKQWEALAGRDPDDAIEWLKNARFRKGKGARSATDLGSTVHAACEEYVISGTRPACDEEVRPFLDQFDGWLNRFQPEYQAAEVTVYDPDYGVAGTTDCFLTIDGVRLIADYKTSRNSHDKAGKPTSPFPEVALQLAAYRYSKLAAVWRPRRMEAFRRRYYLLSPAEQSLAVPVPEVDGGVCIHITPEHCETYPIRCDEAIYEQFLFTLEAARFPFELASTVIGQPMDAPDDVLERQRIALERGDG